jgi:RNA polymerase sigma-70 factor (ECF subfamily)
MYSKEIALETYEKERSGAELDSPLDRIRTDRSLVFDELFERYQAMVFNLAYRILGDREEALDISQEVFLIIYRKLHRFRGDSSLKTWVYRIAINRASNRCRWWNRLRRRGTVSLDQHLAKDSGFNLSETLETDDRSPEENLLSKERSLEIQRSLLRLPVPQRVAVVMRDIEGMSYEEIAASTQTTLGTVKSRIARGREELKRHLNGALG